MTQKTNENLRTECVDYKYTGLDNILISYKITKYISNIIINLKYKSF